MSERPEPSGEAMENQMPGKTQTTGTQTDGDADRPAEQGQIKHLQNQIDDLKKMLDPLREEMEKLQTDNQSLQREVQWLRREHTNPDPSSKNKKMTKKEEKEELRNSVRLLKSDNDELRGQIEEARTQMESAMSEKLDSVKTEYSQMISQLQEEHESKISRLEEKEKNLQTALSGKGTQLDNLETKMGEISTTVTFQAKLKSSLTTTEVTTLVCGEVLNNTSGSYDAKTGKFTAPVSGTYCFLATSSPNEWDDDVAAAVDVVVDGEARGGLCSYGYRWSTAHCVVQLKKGHQVWLRTLDGQYTFAGGWWTTFSGMLLQAEL